MAGLDIKTTNTTIAAALVTATLVPRCYAWPVESVAAGEAIVGYPTELELAVTFGRGADRATIPVWFICGLPQDESTMDRVSALVLAATDVADVINAALGTTGAVSTQFGAFEPVDIGGLPRLAVRFDVSLQA
jgi:hypothetical protein